jgi:site-specific DNA-methyltransferase (adenine-specific)
MNSKLTKITEIKTNPNNPRIIKDEKFQQLVDSIIEFPKMLELRPIVVNEDMVVLGGNMRLKACKAAGLKEVPVIKASDLTEDQQKQFIIKDNVGFGEWDWNMLKLEWDEEQLKGWGLDIPVFDTEEKVLAEEDFYEIPEEIKTDIVEGDLFEIGDHKLLCGSSLETDSWKKLLGDKLIDLVVTDPPYNVNYVGKTKDALTIQNDSMDDNSFYQFLYDFYTATNSYTKPGGGWYVWHASSEQYNFVKAFMDAGMLYKQTLIWVKNTIVMGRQDYHWKHEPCIYGWNPGGAHYFIDDRTKHTVIEDKVEYNKMNRKQLLDVVKDITNKTSVPTDVIYCDKPFRNDIHPTMKPIKLMAPLIENSSRYGEIIGDGFLGSGSTMVASHQMKRVCYGIELDPKYCQVIIERMVKLDPTLKVKRNGKDYIVE